MAVLKVGCSSMITCNPFPSLQDLEHTVEEDGRLRGGCTAAFSVVDDKGERLIILSEMRSPNVRAGSRRVGASAVQPLSSSSPHRQRSPSSWHDKPAQPCRVSMESLLLLS